ncbi:MAG: ion transporter [Methanolinea sp.]|nr:MAG: ion transporter [Methanolinea sp.]
MRESELYIPDPRNLLYRAGGQLYRRIKNRVYEIVDVVREGDTASIVFNGFIVAVIVLSIFVIMLESIRSVSLGFAYFFIVFELISIGIFTIEYILRLWSCTSNPAYERPATGRLRYALTPLAVIDLLAILPFFVPFLLPFDLRFIRVIRLARIFRLLKLARYSSAFHLLGRVVKREKDVLAVIIFVITILIIISSSLMYYIENQAQPEAFSSIPVTMWWAVETLTTVGYGDVYPVTYAGKILGALISFLGIGLFALPAGVLAAGFISELKGEGDNQSADSPEHQLELLERLAHLKEAGFLTDEEFKVEKERIIGLAR